MMTAGGVGVRLAGPFDWTPGGHVDNDWEQGRIKLRVSERQFPIDQFFM